jgi:hypothetical protein
VLHTDAEREFSRLLELLGEVAELPGRFLCADITMNAVAIEHSDVHESLNRNAEFWALASNGLHTCVFVTLHRLLDHASAGNVYAVLNCARSNPEMFSRSALATRRGGPGAEAAQWAADAHEATVDDFKRLESEISHRRQVYDRVYRPIRGKILAHRVFVGADESERYAATRVDELLTLCSFFPAFHHAMFHWFHNGGEATLRPTLAAIDAARRVVAGTPAQHAVVKHTERVMESLRKNR